MAVQDRVACRCCNGTIRHASGGAALRFKKRSFAASVVPCRRRRLDDPARRSGSGGAAELFDLGDQAPRRQCGACCWREPCPN